MTRFLAILCTILIALPAPLYAQTVEDLLKDPPPLELVPKPETTACVEGQRCLDLEGYKLFLQMRTQYVWLHKVHHGLIPSLALELKNIGATYKDLAATQEARGDRWEGAYNELFPKYVQAVKQAERAKGTSVFGGGFVWVIVAGVTGIAVGLAGGIWLENQLSASN